MRASNNEAERRGAVLPTNAADLSRLSSHSLAHRRCAPRALELIVMRPVVSRYADSLKSRVVYDRGAQFTLSKDCIGGIAARAHYSFAEHHSAVEMPEPVFGPVCLA